MNLGLPQVVNPPLPGPGGDRRGRPVPKAQETERRARTVPGVFDVPHALRGEAGEQAGADPAVAPVLQSAAAAKPAIPSVRRARFGRSN